MEVMLYSYLSMAISIKPLSSVTESFILCLECPKSMPDAIDNISIIGTTITPGVYTFTCHLISEELALQPK
jgi:hypothetical protein